MSRSTDAGYYFQTDASQQDIERRALKSKNSNGDPIKLTSKILAVIADPINTNQIYVAESAGTARRIALDTRNTSHVYRGPTAPVTCLTLNQASTTLFAGCWDKTIWSWDVASRAPSRRYHGHSDFVKAVVCTHLANTAGASTELLISGSADATILVWNASTGAKLHVLKGHTRGVLDLAIDAASLASPAAVPAPSATLFSAGSDREIRRWRVAPSSASQIDAGAPILAHETSVNRLHFPCGGDPDGEDLWTASSDNSARCLSRRRGWEADTVLAHPDFVRDVVVDEGRGWVVTACRDEEVRVWDAATGRLACTYSGHFEEVTGLCLVAGSVVVSVSIDGTVRRWSLRKEDVVRAREEAERGDELVSGENRVEVGKKSLLTEDEERELAELMAEDDDE